MKIPGKKLSRFLGNEKARTQLLSAIVVALLTLTAITGFFVALPRQASAATIISEDFEDISDWTQGGTTNLVQSTYTVHGGTYSGHVVTTDATSYIYPNVSLGGSAFTIDFYLFYNTTTTAQPIASIRDIPDSPTRIIGVTVNINGTINLYVKKTGVGNDHISTDTVSTGSWHRITVVGNNGTVYAFVDNTEYVNASYEVNTYSYVIIGSTSTRECDYYVDDYSLSDTAEYPSNDTIDITVSGYDTDEVIHLPTAIITDTAGDTVWSNASANYGILVCENTGTATINNLTVHIEDFTDGVGEITHLYTNKTGTWTEIGTGVTDGGNITVMSSGTPYTLSSGDKIYFIFKIVVPSAWVTTDGTYYSGGAAPPNLGCYITAGA